MGGGRVLSPDEGDVFMKNVFLRDKIFFSRALFVNFGVAVIGPWSLLSCSLVVFFKSAHYQDLIMIVVNYSSFTAIKG